MKKIIFAFSLVLMSAFILKIKWHSDPLVPRNGVRSFLQYPLTAGLPKILTRLNFQLTHNNQRNIVYVIVHEPDYELDYRSPEALRISLLKNDISKLSVGHMQIAWSCKINDRLYESATGFSGDSSNISYDLIKNGFGVSALVTTYLDGHFESPSDVQSYLISSLKKKKLTILALNVGDHCKQVLKNVWTSINSSHSSYFSIGLVASDKNITGRSCSSMAISWLAHLPNIQHYLVSGSLKLLKVPYHLFGHPKDATVSSYILLPSFLESINHTVSPLSIFPSRWPQNGVEVILYDPGTLAQTIVNSNFDYVDFDNFGIKSHAAIFKDEFPAVAKVTR